MVFLQVDKSKQLEKLLLDMLESLVRYGSECSPMYQLLKNLLR